MQVILAKNIYKFQTHFIDKLRVQVYNVTRGDTMLGENIRNLRKENKLSQEELAEKLGVARLLLIFISVPFKILTDKKLIN